MGNSKLVCPVCGENDRIERVKIAHEKGIHTGKTYHVEGERIDTSTQSQLSRQLEPPKEQSGCFEYSGLVSAGIGSLVAVVALLWLIQNDSNNTTALGCVSAFIIIALLSLWINNGKIERINTQRPLIQPAKDRWNRSYLCYRDGIAFDPITGTYDYIENFTDFLYR